MPRPVPTEPTGRQIAASELPTAGTLASLHQRPFVIQGATKEIVCALKVDSVRRNAGLVEVTGWLAGTCQLDLACDGAALECAIGRMARPDVAAALRQTEPAEGFGFVITAPSRVGSYTVRVRALVDGEPFDRTFPIEVPETTSPVRKTAPPVQALAFIEGAVASSVSGHAVLAGWIVHEPQVRVWVENQQGVPFGFADAHRVYRPDVVEVHGPRFGPACTDAGFILLLEDVAPGDTLRVLAQNGAAPVVLAEVECTSLPADPVAASRWLFGLSTPLADMHRRLLKIDLPIIEALMAARNGSTRDLPITIRQLGNASAKPLVSVIVPLYGRSDFVEHQLMEFSRDAWFKEHAELVYVVDDPSLVTSFGEQAEALHRLYQIPFRWAWGGANRGFSGANNLGAQHSRAETLLFLNSDAFPQQPGWIGPLLEALSSNPRLAAVGARLVFGNGAIQHAGMKFVRRDELGIWVNHHPHMGLDPSLDPHENVTVVPAVTGACLAVRRAQFDEVGGWDTGYLIGDFEDSDLCLKLRSAGWEIGYHPGVQLTHLERQSFKLLGDGDYRTKVVIHNAVRHQNRWQALLDSPGRK